MWHRLRLDPASYLMLPGKNQIFNRRQRSNRRLRLDTEVYHCCLLRRVVTRRGLTCAS